MNANYPLVMKRGSLSSFTAATSEEYTKRNCKMGTFKVFSLGT